VPVIRKEFSDPRILRRPLEIGVTVVAAHCATKSGLTDREYFHVFSDGRTSLYFYDRLDGNGRGTGKSISIDVAIPGDIDDLWATATGKKGSGFRSEKGKIDPDALRVRAKNGTATARDKIKLTFDVSAIKHFQTGEITTCTYRFAKAEKV
jgi:hypothetical protein